jgi:hypothetical protein
MSTLFRAAVMIMMLAPHFAARAQAEPTYYGMAYRMPYDGYYRDYRAYRPMLVPAPVYDPPVIVLVPMRPASCGRYRYWDGERCADARFEPPYLGPRW